MKVGDVVISNDKKWLVYLMDHNMDNELFIYVLDFETQKFAKILLEAEIQEVIEIPENVKFLTFYRREKELADIKEYV